MDDHKDIFLNILILFNPNPSYNKTSAICGTSNKNISLINQFSAFCKSIVRHLQVPYRISIVHSNEFATDEINILNMLPVDLLHCSCKHIYDIGSMRYKIDTKIKGTHRLIAETDMLMLQNPDFDWDVDFQFGYDNPTPDRKILENQISRFNLKPLSKDINWNIPHLFIRYVQTNNHSTLPPGINNGLVLIKEEIAIRLYDDYLSEIMPSLYQQKFDTRTAHYIGQWMMGPILLSISDNWKPFPSSINYLLKVYDVNKFRKNRIQLLHYCGVGSGELVQQHFKEYF